MAGSTCAVSAAWPPASRWPGAQRQLDVIAKQLERAYPENETWKVSQTDLQVFAVVTLTLLGSGLAACVLPARRATRVPAMDALRSE